MTHLEITLGANAFHVWRGFLLLRDVLHLISHSLPSVSVRQVYLATGAFNPHFSLWYWAALLPEALGRGPEGLSVCTVPRDHSHSKDPANVDT